jgi:hypothetical protein
MKTLVTGIFVLFCFTCFAQKTNRARSFKAVTYNADGSVWNSRVELIKDTATVFDLYFISKNFYNIPLPVSFSSNSYKSQKIETSNGGTNQAKRTQTLVYDEYSHVINFGISGCVICNDLGYQYAVHYNLNNQVDMMTGAPEAKSGSKKYVIYYYPNDDVKRIDCLVEGKLSVQITLF